MTKPVLTAVAAVAVAGGLYFAVARMAGGPTAAAGPPPAEEITYICRETKKLSRGPRQPTPAINPKTGRATLVQALYCPTCRKWYPAPPAALSERMPGGPVCPKTGTPLLETEGAP
ncbi:MAG: hypothetical protein ACT4QC_15475 [Planctomycetaceae bacterium]